MLQLDMVQKNSPSGFAEAQAGGPSPASAKTRALGILDHIERAKASKIGLDITDLTEDQLVADLRQHQMLG